MSALPGCASVVCVLFLGVAIPTAGAQEFPEATASDYNLDVYTGNAIGSNEIISMGGAAVAIARGSAGMQVNPAAPAVRTPTSKGVWDWDVHVDWLGTVAGNDFDNNGISDDTANDSSPQITLGGVVQKRKWGLGATLSAVEYEGVTTTGAELDQVVLTAQLHLARSFLSDQLVLGVGFKATTFTLSEQPMDAAMMNTELFTVSQSTVESGVVWMPKNRNLRLGSSFTLPATGKTVSFGDDCMADIPCRGIILPATFEVPWSMAAGVGLRRAPNRWNKKVEGRFKDERELIVALDLRLTGAVKNGHGISQISQNRLQPSGDKVVVSVRGGVQFEWVPGWLRLRGGSYYEPSRFRDADGNRVSGRPHITAGTDVRFWQFTIWSRTYRLRLSGTLDLAERYLNGGASIGFWH